MAHWVDYFHSGPRIPQSESDGQGWGIIQNQGQLWSEEELTDLRKAVEAEGLTLAAIENLDPSHWHDVLLDGPLKRQQLEDVKTIVRNLGAAGIPVLGYNFSIAGVWGHVVGPWARGGAESVGFSAATGPKETPIPNGQVWNMTYDPDAPAAMSEGERRAALDSPGGIPARGRSGGRGSRRASRRPPGRPPLPSLRGTARLVHKPEFYQRLLDIHPSPSNALEFCQGTIAEMVGEMDVYEAIDTYSKSGDIAYVHFRNVRGKVRSITKSSSTRGMSTWSAPSIYHRNGYDGVIIPDHTPQMECAASWHAGMAYALGWMRAPLFAS